MERKTLESFVAQRGAGVELIKEIIEFHLSDLIDIRNIDPKGNVGLQTCSRQIAYDTLEQIFSVIFSDAQPEPKEVSEKNHWR